MTYLNPLIAPIVQGPQAQKAAAAEKERQVARAQALAKNSAAEGDRFEHQVESAGALSGVGDDTSHGGQARQQHQQRKPSAQQGAAGEADADPPHIDITG